MNANRTAAGRQPQQLPDPAWKTGDPFASGDSWPHYFGDERDPLQPEVDADGILVIADSPTIAGVDPLDLAGNGICPDCGRPFEVHVDEDGQDFYCPDCLTFGISPLPE
jgi:hypothetical protein